MSGIKAILFDFDNCLADLKEAHYVALNKALESIDSKYIITPEEHLSIYDGLSTKTKLKMLGENKGLLVDKFDEIFELKQKYTIEYIESNIKEDICLISILSKLKMSGYIMCVCSNAIRQTIELGLEKIGISRFFDKIYSNEDVKTQKPNPEIYLRAMADFSLLPKETIIVEDSKHGREAAVKSEAFVCGIDNPGDLTEERLDKIINYSKYIKKPVKWAGKANTTVLIAMAGRGSRFTKEAGYNLPKPLIDVNGKPMIQMVIENLNIDANYVFVVQKEHCEKYNLDLILNNIVPDCKIVYTDKVTEGAACTALLAKEYINNLDHLLIANCDQYVVWDSCDFMYKMISWNVDGGILTFKDPTKNPKWSFAKINENGFVIEVAEKKPISNLATVGIYYYKYGSDFVNYAEEMIEKNLRINNEFYICPVYNLMLASDKVVKTYNCDKMFGVGVPGDLAYFLENGPK